MPHILCVEKKTKPYHSRRDRHDNETSPSIRLKHKNFNTEIAYEHQLLMSSSRYPSGESFYSQDYGAFADMVGRDPVSPTSSCFSSLSSEQRSGSEESHSLETPSKWGPSNNKISSELYHSGSSPAHDSFSALVKRHDRTSSPLSSPYPIPRYIRRTNDSENENQLIIRTALGRHTISDRQNRAKAANPCTRPRCSDFTFGLSSPASRESPLRSSLSPLAIFKLRRELVLNQPLKKRTPGLTSSLSTSKIDNGRLQALVYLQLLCPTRDRTLRRRFILLVILIFRTTGLYDKILLEHGTDIPPRFARLAIPEDFKPTVVSLALHLAHCGIQGHVMEDFVFHHIRCCKLQGVPAGTGI